MHLPDNFKQSYLDFESYPRNLISASFFGALNAYKRRLDNAASKLFATGDGEVCVPFRDWAGLGFQRYKALSDADLTQWLGDRSFIDPNTGDRVGELAVKTDPICRFIFVGGDNSRSPLWITQKMLGRILSYHQVMPQYLDFIAVFGRQTELRDLRFSGFRAKVSLGTNTREPAIPDLGQSGQQYQLCYNIKAPYLKESGDKKKSSWTIRQAAFHHQFDVVRGTALWIVTVGNTDDLKGRVQDMTGKDGRPEDRSFTTVQEAFKSSMAVHFLYCHWSSEGWRYYIQFLEETIESQTRIAKLDTRDLREMNYSPSDLQTLQHHEDEINQAKMILEADAKIMTSLRDFYVQLLDSPEFPLRQSSREDVKILTSTLNEVIEDSKLQVSRADLLVRIAADRRTLILQHLQGQATAKMEDMTISMHKVGVESQRETIVMRIIAVITGIFLPATFVSTFFSTDIVRYQNESSGSTGIDATSPSATGNNNGSFSSTAMKRWLQVTLPLTFLTFLFGIIWFKSEERKRNRRLRLHADDLKDAKDCTAVNSLC